MLTQFARISWVNHMNQERMMRSNPQDYLSVWSTIVGLQKQQTGQYLQVFSPNALQKSWSGSPVWHGFNCQRHQFQCIPKAGKMALNLLKKRPPKIEAPSFLLWVLDQNVMPRSTWTACSQSWTWLLGHWTLQLILSHQLIAATHQKSVPPALPPLIWKATHWPQHWRSMGKRN